MEKAKLLLASILAVMLVGCVTHDPNPYRTQISNQYVQENWMPRINIDPNQWTKGSSRWFNTGYPLNFAQYAPKAQPAHAITAMVVRVPNFRNIKISGPFQVQIVGGQYENSLLILGGNDQARHVQVLVKDNTLSIRPAPDCKTCKNLSVVEVRIGVRHLNGLWYNGSGRVEGKNIHSSPLLVRANGSGTVLLTGEMNLAKLDYPGSGTVSIIGVFTPTLDITNTGCGTINLSGRVGVRHVVNRGNGKINIIGADSNALTVEALSGFVTMAGNVNLQKLVAGNNSRVYLYWVRSNGIYADVHHGAHVGLAGTACDLNLESDGYALFKGKNLKTTNVYVRTRNKSHANVFPINKLFANALDYSSIYFFNSPTVLQRYMQNHGLVLPIFNLMVPRAPACPVKVKKKYRRVAYK